MIRWVKDILNNLLSISLKHSKKLPKQYPFSSYFSLVLILHLMLKESQLLLMFPQITAVSLIFLWVKVKKIELKRLSLIVLKKDTGLCFKMYILCKVGCMDLMVLKVSLRVCLLHLKLILISVSSFLPNLLMSYFLLCKLFLNLFYKDLSRLQMKLLNI